MQMQFSSADKLINSRAHFGVGDGICDADPGNLSIPSSRVDQGMASDVVALRSAAETQSERVCQVHEVKSDTALQGRVVNQAAAEALPRSLSTPNLFGLISSNELADLFLDAMDDVITQLSEDSQRSGVPQGVFFDALSDGLTQKMTTQPQAQPYLKVLLPIATSFVQTRYSAARSTGWGNFKRSIQNLTAGLSGNNGYNPHKEDNRRLSLSKLDTLVRDCRENKRLVEDYFYKHSALVRKPGESEGRKRVTFAPMQHLARKVNTWPQGSLMLVEQALSRLAEKLNNRSEWSNHFTQSVDDVLASVDAQEKGDISPVTPGFLRGFAQWVVDTPITSRLSLKELRHRLPETLNKYESTIDWSDGEKKRMPKGSPERLARLREMRSMHKSNGEIGPYYSVDSRVLHYEELDQARDYDNDAEGLPPLCPKVVANHMPHLRVGLPQKVQRARAERHELCDRFNMLQTQYRSGALDETAETQMDRLYQQLEQLDDYIAKMERCQSSLPPDNTPEAVIKHYPKLFDPAVLHQAEAAAKSGRNHAF